MFWGDSCASRAIGRANTKIERTTNTERHKWMAKGSTVGRCKFSFTSNFEPTAYRFPKKLNRPNFKSWPLPVLFINCLKYPLRTCTHSVNANKLLRRKSLRRKFTTRLASSAALHLKETNLHPNNEAFKTFKHLSITSFARA